MAPRTNKGGKREGAGRKPLGPTALVQYTVRLAPETAQAVREYGEGNLSEGIRKLALMLPPR